MEPLIEFWSAPWVQPIVLLIVGAGLSALTKELPTFIRNYKRVTPLLGGPWHAYHWSRTNGHPVFRHTTLTCRRRLYGVRIDVTSSEGEKSFYKGRVSFEGADLLLEFSGRKHTETFVMRMNEPISHSGMRMVGIVLGVDFDRVKFAAVQICLRSEVSQDEAMQIIADVAELDGAESSLRVIRAGDRDRLSRGTAGAA